MDNNLISFYIDNINVNLFSHSARYYELPVTECFYNYTTEFNSIGYICEGDGCIEIDDEKIYPTAGDLYLLPANTVQSYYSYNDTPHKKYYCHFIADSGTKNFFDIVKVPLCVHAENKEEIIRTFEEICALNNEKSLLSVLRIKTLVMQLICHYLTNAGTVEIKHTEEKNQKMIEDTLLYIEKNLDGDLSVSTLAQRLFFNPNYFTYIFKKITGSPPNQYVVQRRIYKAIDLMLSSSMSISDIAELTGFKNQFYFSNTFKRINGITPSEYRKIMKS